MNNLNVNPRHNSIFTGVKISERYVTLVMSRMIQGPVTLKIKKLLPLCMGSIYTHFKKNRISGSG